MNEIIYSAVDTQARVIEMKLIALLGKPGFYKTFAKAYELAQAGDYDDDEYDAVTFDTGDEVLDRLLYDYTDYAAYVRHVVGELDESGMIEALVRLSELSGMVQGVAEEVSNRKDKARKSVGKRWDNDPKKTIVMPIAKALCDAWAVDPSLYKSETAAYMAVLDKAHPRTVSINTFRGWRKKWKATE